MLVLFLAGTINFYFILSFNFTILLETQIWGGQPIN